MNSIDKNIFNDYTTVETALLNELATEVKTKGKKARTVKGEGYYVKYDGVKYDITDEQCRIHRLIRNNYNMFVEQLNSAKSDILGVWKNVWGERLPAIIADLEKGIAICQKYFDAFKSFITEPEVAVENVTESGVVTTSENETSTEESVTPEGAHNFVDGSYKDLQNQEHPTAPHGGSSCTIKKHTLQCPYFALKRVIYGLSIV